MQITDAVTFGVLLQCKLNVEVVMPLLTHLTYALKDHVLSA